MGIAVAGTLAVMDAAQRGQRLERYIRARWDRQQGGLRGLAAQAGVSSDSLYKWFRGESEPSLEGLGSVAAVLGVKRYELVAVYDGDKPSADLAALLDPELRGQLVDLIATEIARQHEA